MYVAQYRLGTPYDISSAAFGGTSEQYAADPGRDIWFDASGTVLYIKAELPLPPMEPVEPEYTAAEPPRRRRLRMRRRKQSV